MECSSVVTFHFFCGHIVKQFKKLEKPSINIQEDLIRRCRENDREAQFELYRQNYKQMYNTSLRIVNNTAEAEDIMQDSFLDAFRKIDAYTGEGNFGGWLRRIVVNNSLDAIKRKKSSVSIDDTPMDFETEDDNYTETVEYKVEEIKKAVTLLPEDHRVIVSLFLFEGYDHEEISQILGISYNASRTRFSRAKQKLLTILSSQRSEKIFHPN